MKLIAKKIIQGITLAGAIIALILNSPKLIDLFTEKPNISGEWWFKFHTKESSYSPYINSITEYRMHLIQTEEKISGEGETWKYNGENLPFARHRDLKIKGVYEKDSIICTYRLFGYKRESTGSFKAFYNKQAEQLEGHFSGNAANTKGIFFAKRIN